MCYETPTCVSAGLRTLLFVSSSQSSSSGIDERFFGTFAEALSLWVGISVLDLGGISYKVPFWRLPEQTKF